MPRARPVSCRAFFDMLQSNRFCGNLNYMGNYSAWEINPDDFYKEETMEGKLNFLVRFGILAPSSHNTQPWKFEIESGGIILAPNLERSLPHSDTNNRQLYISLGCALENILVAADYYGLKNSIEYVLHDETPRIKIVLEESILIRKEQTRKHLVFAIPRRCVNRGKYANEFPDENLRVLTRGFGNSNIKIHTIREETPRMKIGDITVRAGITAMDDQNFRRELSCYVKNNMTKSFVGMPAFGMGIPTPVSFLAPFLVRRLNMNKKAQKKDRDLLIKFTPVFCIITTRNDDAQGWIEAGRTYEQIALRATAAQTATAPMAAAIQIGDFYKELQGILSDEYRPQVFFRLGYGTKTVRHSPRLSVEEVIELK